MFYHSFRKNIFLTFELIKLAQKTASNKMIDKPVPNSYWVEIRVFSFIEKFLLYLTFVFIKKTMTRAKPMVEKVSLITYFELIESI